MSSKLSLTAIFFFLVHSLLAQRGPTDFGDVTFEDLKDNSSEPSVVLFDKAEFVYPNFKRHIRIKINQKEAFGQWADFKVDNDIGVISNIKAATYFIEEGRIVVVPVEDEAIHSDRKHTNEKSVPMSNVRAGCIVELSYKTTFLGAIPFWTIQRNVPVLWSEFRMSSPVPLTYFVRGNISADIVELKHHSRWVFKNVPAHKNEPHMPAHLASFARLEFWDSPSTWEEMAKWLNKKYSIKYQTFPARALKQKAEELTVGVADPLTKAKIIHQFVKNHFTWNDRTNYLPGDLNQIFENRKGTSGDLNAVLFNMLEFAGLNPQPVLLRTTNVGPLDKSFATTDQFNYMLCSLTIMGKQFLLDATSAALPFEALPVNCLNTAGFLVEEKNFRWIEITQTVPAKTVITATLSLDSSLSLNGKIAVLSTGYDAFMKSDLHSNDSTSALTEFSIPETTKFDSAYRQFPDEMRMRFVELYRGTIPGNIVETDNKLFVSPFFIVNEYENTFKSLERKMPIDFGISSEFSFVVRLTVPAGYKVQEIPADKRFAMPDNSISCSFKTTYSDKLIVITYQFGNQRTYFTPEEYPQLRELNSLIIERQAEQIVLSK